jgi:hypothetical protein
LNGRAVFASKHALALAHASRGGKCKRRGSPPGTKWRAAAGRSAQAQRGRLGCLLSRARDGVPQQAFFPWLFAERMNDCICFRGRALREGTARRGECRKTAATWPAGGREETSSLLALLSAKAARKHDLQNRLGTSLEDRRLASARRTDCQIRKFTQIARGTQAVKRNDGYFGAYP